MHGTLYALCADCAGGIVRAAGEGLHVAFVPDLFHGQKTLTDAFARPLQQRVKQAHEASRELAVTLLTMRAANDCDANAPVAPGSSLDLAERAEAAARSAYCAAVEDQRLLGEVRRGLGLVLHPVNLFDGKLRDAQTVDGDLHDTLDRLEPVAARLGERCVAAVASVRALTLGWSLSVYRGYGMVEARLTAENLSPSLLRLLWTVLIPACYLAWV